ncbi:Importin-11, partial [Neolecta irregularis DAH-3]
YYNYPKLQPFYKTQSYTQIVAVSRLRKQIFEMAAAVPQELIQALTNASSQDPTLVKSAEGSLKEWEIQHGFFESLQLVFLDPSLPYEMKWLSIILLKNGIDKYWRRTARNGIPATEKERIRSRMFTALEEPSRQLAAQNAMVMARAVRLDYPLDWPTVFPQLLDFIRNASKSQDQISQSRLRNGLLALHQTIKALCSSRLIKARQNLQQIAPELFHFLRDLYTLRTQQWMSNIPQSYKAFAMDNSLLALKSCRRVLVHGFECANRNQEVRDFFQLLCLHLSTLLPLYYQSPHQEVKPAIRKHIVVIGKLFTDFFQNHSAAFVLMPDAIPLIKSYWHFVELQSDSFDAIKDKDDQRFLEKVIVQGMLLVKLALKTLSNPSSSSLNFREKDEKAEIRQASQLLKDELFTTEMLHRIVETLVTKYFIMRKADFEAWEEDPEAFILDEEQASWEHQLRPCSEKLFSDLMCNFKETLITPLLAVLEATATPQDSRTLLMKDAIYNAFALASSSLYEAIDFDHWLTQRLMNEVQVANPSYKVLRRQIARIIGSWVCVKCSKEMRPMIYTTIQHLMNKQDPVNDIVVRLTAVDCLRASVDEWDFEADKFLPFMEYFLDSLIMMMDEVEHIEIRLKILNVLGVVVERMELNIKPFSQRIVDLLPPLWQQSFEQHLIKSAILVMLTKLVWALKEESVLLHPIIFPLVQHSPEHVYLLEDALELWQATITNLSAMTPDLFSLVSAAIHGLQYGSDTLKKYLDIVESYFMLVPEEMLDNYSHLLFRSLFELVGELKPSAAQLVLRLVDIILQTCPSSSWAEGLASSGLIIKIVKSVLVDQEIAIVITNYLSLFSRIAMADPNILIRYFGLVGQELGGQDVVPAVIDRWTHRYDNIGHPKHRKLNAMGLAMILRTNREDVLNSLGSFMNVWYDALSEVKENNGGDALIYWQDPDDTAFVEEESPEAKRRRELFRSDPVHSTHLLQFIRENLSRCEQENGGSEIFRHKYYSKIDSALLDQMQSVL